MSLLLRGSLVLGVLAGWLLLGPAPRAQAQAKNPNKDDPVNFDSVDGVELKGTFYKGPKGKGSPVVLLVHAWGSDRTKGDWDGLATRLQKDHDCAVLSFDLRGHGGSTSVIPKFWENATNRKLLKGKPNRPTIHFKEMQPAYLPMLVNDLTAARRYLDQRNDAGDCNTSNLFVIGAQEGATLGMLWIASEWGRSVAPVPVFPPTQARYGGPDVAGAVWLSFTQHPLRQNMPFQTWRKLVPELRDKVPQLFLSSQEDKLSTQDSLFIYNNVLQADTNLPKSPKPANTFLKPIKGGQQARGVDLLGKAKLNTEDLILKYLEKIDKKAVWQEQKPQPLYPVPLGRLGFPAL